MERIDEQAKMLELFSRIKKGEISPEQALLEVKSAPFEDLGYAKVDHHRGIRQGAHEVIYGAGKTAEQMLGIIRSMEKRGTSGILITRLSQKSADYLARSVSIEYDETARIAVVNRDREAKLTGCVVVASGGTSDLPVCEEAAITAETLGSRVHRLYDVGVAGIHRLLSNSRVIMSARVIVAVAGMEGALPSVIGGLADCPVIAVPTSIGYGSSFGGVSALLGMLNSCASGLSVVNIDNGFGAGYLANMINKMDGIAEYEAKRKDGDA